MPSSSSSTIGSNSSSLLGTIGGGSGRQWTSLGPSSSSSSSINQQLFIKQQSHLFNGQQLTSSHFDSILGSTMNSSSQSQMEKNFELQQEDFPPLPHRSLSHESTSTSSTSHVQPSYQSQFSSPGQTNLTNGSYVAAPTQQSQSQSPISFKSSIEPFSALISRQHNKTSPSSSSSTTATTTTTISQSGSTITDQYGLVGLLQMIQQAEQKPDSSILLNFDLTTLGLSMESQNDLYPTFLSPFSDNQARAYEIDYQVPTEYQMGIQIRDKLPQVNFNTLNEDTLFFLFYLFGNDYVQLSSASELYRRDWRYHKEERLWLTRIKNIMPDQKHDTYETGVYCVFDVQLWRKTHKSMRIDYEKLDGPVLKQHDLLTSKFLQQQGSGPSYGPMSYNTNVSR